MNYATVCSGVGAPELAWNALGWRAQWCSEIEAFPSAVLKHHWPDVPNYGDVYSLRVDPETKKVWSDGSAQKELSESDSNVYAGSICSDCGEPLRSDSAVNVGLAEKTGRKVSQQHSEGKQESFFAPSSECDKMGDEDGRESNQARRSNTPDTVRNMRCSMCSEEQPATDRSPPRRLQQAADRSVVMQKMPLHLAPEQYSSASIDVLCGGFPCQDLSIAGKREGLENDFGVPTRSGLVHRIIELADAIECRWVVLENVPGIFSSSGGRDFAAVVGELAGTRIPVPREGWENAGFALGPKGLIEWAVLDAQYFGVPQRRRRVFIVRDSGDWTNRPPLLFDRESLRGNFAAQQRKQQRYAADTSSGVGGESLGGRLNPVMASGEPVAGTLTANNGKSHFAGDQETRSGGFHVVETVAFSKCDDGRDGNLAAELGGTVSAALRASQGGSDKAFMTDGLSVRRLTPLEAERLQGFPDYHTAIPYNGKPAKDTPRYKAIGNSMAVPVLKWIGERISFVDGLPETP